MGYQNNNNNQNTRNYGFPQNNNNYSKKRTNEYSRENSKNFESQNSLTMDAQNFPSLSGEIEVNVPTNPLFDSNVMVDDSEFQLNSLNGTKQNRADIVTKFNEQKNTES